MNRPTQKRNYLGIACTLHDPAIAVVDSEGRIVFAEAAERHLQYKRAFASIADDPVFVGRVLRDYTEPDAEIVIRKRRLSRRALP